MGIVIQLELTSLGNIFTLEAVASSVVYDRFSTLGGKPCFHMTTYPSICRKYYSFNFPVRSKMTKTNARVGFKTRYCIQAIDRLTALPASEEIRVENMVLRNGMLALGNEVAYSNISIGTSDIPTSFDHTGLVTIASELLLSEGSFEQTIFQSPTSNDIISRITREFIFKDFRFPSNSRTLTLREIGISGVTRAVLPTALEINQNHWVKVTLEIDYIYRKKMNQTIPLMVNTAGTSEVLKYHITPFIYNPTPQNNSGKGYGIANAILGYVWNGLPEGITDRTYGASLGVTITRELNQPECTMIFKVTGSFTNETVIPGFIVRDTINGGAFKITFPEGLNVQEDDVLDLVIAYSWRQDPISTPL